MKIKKKKVAIITGANSGIGKSILKKFIKKNIYVIGISRTKQGKIKINKIVKNNGKGIVLNVTNMFLIKKIFKEIYKKFKKIDILINNAGIISDSLLLNMKKKNWIKVINTNLNSIFYTSKIAIKYMLKNRYGRIVNIGSIIGNIGNTGQTNYSASKSALSGFTKSLALEVAKKNITVNIVSPGFIKTKIIKKINNKIKKKILKKIPLGKLGIPKNIANSVFFLCKKSSNYITGHNLHVNGGMLMK
ncbi:3-oxoacyl-ACP reductase FabG [Buchnera aphidicola]|uniref:3-oxoacyl-ACP reductase FabG n=1 Tax=Buchnera aphidicola TaxID=9 RepID=UPI0030EC4363